MFVYSLTQHSTDTTVTGGKHFSLNLSTSLPAQLSSKNASYGIRPTPHQSLRMPKVE